MRTLLVVVALAGAFVLTDAAVQQGAGSALAIAQSGSSACFQNCTNVRQWPAQQCRRYCRGRSANKRL
jgi:hypothetical protein